MSLIEGRLFLLVFCGFMAIMTWINIRRANSGSLNPVIRPINGLDAIEEAVGRATEMGRPVHYSIGIAGVTDQSAPQTIAGLEILGFTTSLVAKYNARIVATTPTAQVFPIAQEIMRQKFLAAGKPEMFLEETVQFLSSDQFAYSAGAMGFMTREKAAANIMMGAFWAESLLMAEAGAHAGAIQVAGTANLQTTCFKWIARKQRNSMSPLVARNGNGGMVSRRSIRQKGAADRLRPSLTLQMTHNLFRWRKVAICRYPTCQANWAASLTCLPTSSGLWASLLKVIGIWWRKHCASMLAAG